MKKCICCDIISLLFELYDFMEDRIKEVLLPFHDQPYNLMYHNTAFPMGIIQANATQDLTPWLCGKYINCYFKTFSGSNKFVNCITDNWAEKDQILLKQRLELAWEHYEIYFGNIISLLKNMLDLGNYVHGRYNEQLIPGKSAFQKEYLSHDYLLIGYDDSQEHFVSVGYLADHKFQRYYIPYDNMYQAIRTLKNAKIFINFWNYNSNAFLGLNRKRIISELNDYVNSELSQKVYTERTFYGMEAIQQLKQFLFDSAKKDGWLDYRYIRGVMEHKFFMHMRIKYLLETGVLQNAEYLQNAEAVYKMSERTHMLGLKYLMTRKDSVLEGVVQTMDQMMAVEQCYLPKVLTDLQAAWRDEV